MNGTYLTAQNGQSFIDCTLSAALPTVEVQVEAPRSCAGATVVASFSMTSYFPGCSGPGQPSPNQRAAR